jgi:hypothetical protein
MSGEGLISSQADWESKEGRRRIPRGTVVCPVCEYEGRIHGGEHVTPLVKTLWCRCTNLLCGMTWRMQLAFVSVVSPSAIDRPGLDLPGSAPLVGRIEPATGPPAASNGEDSGGMEVPLRHAS